MEAYLLLQFQRAFSRRTFPAPIPPNFGRFSPQRNPLYQRTQLPQQTLTQPKNRAISISTLIIDDWLQMVVESLWQRAFRCVFDKHVQANKTSSTSAKWTWNDLHVFGLKESNVILVKRKDFFQGNSEIELQ